MTAVRTHKCSLHWNLAAAAEAEIYKKQCICCSQTSETNILISMKTGKVSLWFWGFTLRNKQVEHSLKGKANAIVTVPSPKVKNCKAISTESEESFVLLT